jgi:hypothetical protein
VRFSDEEEADLEVIIHFAIEKISIILNIDYDSTCFASPAGRIAPPAMGE